MDADLPGTDPPEPVKAVRADALERADRAWRSRIAGAPWSVCAQVAGFTDAANAIRAVRSVYGSLPSIDREDLRNLWRERLELLFRQSLQDAFEQRPGAVTAAVRVEQAAVALDGLNAPTRLLIDSPTHAELEKWVDQVLAVTQSPPIEEADVFDAEYWEEK